MKIRIICVGKLKERFYREAAEEYLKRLSRYADVSVVELSDEKTPERASEKEREQILRKEGERILERIRDDEKVIALAIDGKKYSSEGFSSLISDIRDESRDLAFVIGGSLGLWDQVMKRSDMGLSFSDMTFPHQLMRVILLEQVYRAFRIMNNEPYHK